MASLVDNYTKDELENIVKNSYSMKEVIAKIGYKTQNGNNSTTVKNRLIEYEISTKHFKNVDKTIRTKENVFCINSTATQATLRRWYKERSDDSHCAICNQEKNWQGKPLIMTLDHINGNNHDNREENLRWICPNCASQLPTFAGKNNKSHDGYISTDSKKINKKICPICNINEIYVKSKMCKECRTKKSRANIPSKEELEQLIYTTSFVAIGKKYGVTDNAVRKWCKDYGLPFRYGELHKSAS